MILILQRYIWRISCIVPRLQLLSKILSELQNNGKSSDWEIFTEDDLFPDILMVKEKLLAYSKHDIDIIVKVIEKNTARKIFASKDNKDVRAAKIAFLFGSGKLVYSTPKDVPSLKSIAQNVVEKFPFSSPVCICRINPHEEQEGLATKENY